MIEARELGFGYRKKDEKQIQGVSLTLEEGYFSCLLGPNGAGKTTLLKLLYGMLLPQNGEVLWRGRRVDANSMYSYHREVAYVGGDWCDPSLSNLENARFLSSLYPEFDWEHYDKLAQVLAVDRTDTAYGKLSRGQQVKAEICFHLARRPGYILMDEPLAGLDVVAKEDILGVLQRGIAQDRLGVLMCTHLTEEISDIVDHIAVLRQGRLEAFGEREHVFARYHTDSLWDVARGAGQL